MTASSLRIGMVLSGFLAAGVGALAPPAMVQFDVSRLGGLRRRARRPLAGVLFVGLIATRARRHCRGPSPAPTRRSGRSGCPGCPRCSRQCWAPSPACCSPGSNLVLRPFGDPCAVRAAAPAARGAGEAARRPGGEPEGGRERAAAHPHRLRALGQALPRRDGAPHRGGRGGHLHAADGDPAHPRRGEPLAHPGLPGRHRPHRRRAPRARPDPAAAAPGAHRPAGHHPAGGASCRG